MNNKEAKMKKEATYYIYNDGDNTIIAKIENRSGYRYKDGKWVDYPYIEKALYDDIGFDIISKEEANILIRKLDNK